ncbi:MAG TPA: hypothetical protein VMH01_00105 [Puia sp.]|nr:hypothetical protein [Puia sp.]
MLNISDKDLDRLSREAAEYYEPEDSGLSWKKLEQQLDGEINDKPPSSMPSYRRGPIVIGSLVLLLVGVSYFLIKTIRSEKNSTQKQSTTSVTPSQQESITQSSDSKNNQPASADKSQKQAGQNSLNPQTNSDDTRNESLSGSKKLTEEKDSRNKFLNQPTSVGQPDATTENKTNRNKQNNIGKNRTNNAEYAASAALFAGKSKNTLTGSNGNKLKPGKNNDLNQSGLAVQNNVNGASVKTGKPKNNTVTETANADESLQYATLPGLASYNNLIPTVSDSSLRKFPIKNADNSSVQKNQQSLHINRALKIGLLYAPDYTNVPSGPSNGTSNNIGITIGYEFANRWSVNSGLIYTKKNYGANADDFHAAIIGGGYPPSKLEYVKGNCDMWEIPLSLRYDFASTRKNSFFGSLGLSSYLMKKEEYTFFMEYNTGWGTFIAPKGPYSYTNGNLYLLSIASISAGMEHQFSKGFSLQVEPFMKIPLTGVGLGNLQLNSYGLSFSLRYAPVLNRTRH